jgi:hypothetical protein
LPMKKVVFRKSTFIGDEELLNDDLDLSGLVDMELNNLSAKGSESPLVFAAGNQQADAYAMRGRYTTDENKIAIKVTVFKGNKEIVHRFDVNGTAAKKEEMARIAVQKVKLYLNEIQKKDL